MSIKGIIAAVIVAIASVHTVSAQLTYKAQRERKAHKNYIRLTASYVMQSSTGSSDDFASDDVAVMPDKGVAIGFVKGTRLSYSPLYIETGFDLAWLHRGIEGYGDWDYSQDILSLNIPLLLAVQIRCSNAFNIVFNAGPSFKAHLVGAVNEGSDDYYSLFDCGFKRFQLCCIAGSSINIKRFHIGYRFSPDITPFFEDSDYGDDVKIYTRQQFITLGINF